MYVKCSPFISRVTSLCSQECECWSVWTLSFICSPRKSVDSNELFGTRNSFRAVAWPSRGCARAHISRVPIIYLHCGADDPLSRRVSYLRTVNRSICKAHVSIGASCLVPCSRARCRLFRLHDLILPGVRSPLIITCPPNSPERARVRYWWPTSTVYYPLWSAEAISSFSESTKWRFHRLHGEPYASFARARTHARTRVWQAFYRLVER